MIVTQLPLFVDYRKKIFGPAFCILMLLLGIWLNIQKMPYVDASHFSHFQTDQLIGIIDDEPVEKDKTIRFPLKVICAIDTDFNQEVRGRLMVTIWKDSSYRQIINYGDQLQIKRKLMPISAPLNPNEFNYQKYMANKGIYQQAFLSVGDYEIVGGGKGNFIIDKSLRFRQELIAKFSRYLKNVNEFQIAVALIFGYRSQIDSSTIEVFTDSGTIHVLSVSGLHVSIVFGLLTLLLSWLDRYKYGRSIRCVVIFIAIWCYVVLTGMSPPILRAGIMISFFIVGVTFRRKQVALNTLLTSALFILLFAPHYLFEIGFQLSYLAILGILLLYPLLSQLWLPSNRWLRYLVEYSYISIAAQFFTLPFVLQYFGQVPSYFLPANLFIAIPSTLIMYLGFALAVVPIDVINQITAAFLSNTLHVTLSGLQYIVNMPLSVFHGIVWTASQTFICCLILVLLIDAWNFKNKRSLFVLLSLSTILASFYAMQSYWYSSYVGYKVYSLRSELAIAHINSGQVILLSSLDSLNHASLQFSVLPDLKRYAREDEIHFVKLNNNNSRNLYVKLGQKKILFLEQLLETDEQTDFDFIVWRRNNPNDLFKIREKYKKAKIIFDGSNSNHYLERVLLSQKQDKALYLLKNNFSYVWDKE